MLKLTAAQTDKAYYQILDLLEDITLAADDDAEEAEREEGERELMGLLMEEAVERGMDEEAVERVYRAILNLQRRARAD